MSNRRERAAEFVLLIHYKLIRLFHIIKNIISVIAEFFSLKKTYSHGHSRQRIEG